MAARMMDAHETTIASDNRREWQRIDDQLLLEYTVVREEGAPADDPVEPAGDEAVADLVRRPTAALLTGTVPPEGDPLLVPWLMKIDYVLEIVLKSLVRMQPGGVSMPRLTDVNISAAGMNFRSRRPLRAGELLDLRLILPPFFSIQARAEVVRVAPHESGDGQEIAVKFTEISQDDQERLIKHILAVEAKRLRSRQEPG